MPLHAALFLIDVSLNQPTVSVSMLRRITEPTKFSYYEARFFNGNSRYPLRFRTGLSGVKTEDFVIFFSLSSRLWVLCWGGGQLGEQMKEELRRLDLGGIR